MSRFFPAAFSMRKHAMPWLLLLVISAGPLRAERSWQPNAPTRGADIAPIGSGDRVRLNATGQLSQEAGQVWKEYDIRSFTRRVTQQTKPEQPIVDWILRETGTDTWFGSTMGLLSADRERIRVYHTPRVQAKVQAVVDRFLNTRSEAHEVAVRLVTVEDPNWRIKARPILKTLKVQNPGIEAWLLSREDAALLLYELGKRVDFQEHNSPNLTIYSGQSHTLKSTRPRTFSKGQLSALAQTGNLAENGSIDEGFTLQISPLVGRNGQQIEAVIRCAVDQIEGFTPLWVEGTDRFGVRKRSQLQIPQVSSWRLHERFRWPVDSVLLISRGRVPTPGPTSRFRGSLRKVIEGGPPAPTRSCFWRAARRSVLPPKKPKPPRAPALAITGVATDLCGEKGPCSPRPVRRTEGRSLEFPLSCRPQVQARRPPPPR